MTMLGSQTFVRSSEYIGHLNAKVIWISRSSEGQCRLKVNVVVSHGTEQILL